MRDCKGAFTKGLSFAVSLSLLIPSLPSGAATNPLPATLAPFDMSTRLGFITDSWQPTSSAKPKVVLIQDLHLHYPTQKRIVRILDHLFKTNAVSGPVAVEGVEGVYDTSLLASYPNSRLKHKLVDYFLKKGELSGDEAFSILRGDGKILYGIEKASFYGLNRDLFRKTLDARHALRAQLEPIRKSLPYMKRRNPELEKTVGMLERLLDQEVTLEEARYLAQRLPSVVELTQKLLEAGSVPAASGGLTPAVPSTAELEETLKSAIDFYIVALMRDEPMAKNVIQLLGSVPASSGGLTPAVAMVTGGFHTAGLTKAFKKAGIGYVVITPRVNKVPTEAERALYEKRLTGVHLSEAEFLRDFRIHPFPKGEGNADRGEALGEGTYDDAVFVRANLGLLASFARRVLPDGIRTMGGGGEVGDDSVSLILRVNRRHNQETSRQEIDNHPAHPYINSLWEQLVKQRPVSGKFRIVEHRTSFSHGPISYKRRGLFSSESIIGFDAEILAALVELYQRDPETAVWIGMWILKHEMTHSNDLLKQQHGQRSIRTAIPAAVLGIIIHRFWGDLTVLGMASFMVGDAFIWVSAMFHLMLWRVGDWRDDQDEIAALDTDRHGLVAQPPELSQKVNDAFERDYRFQRVKRHYSEIADWQNALKSGDKELAQTLLDMMLEKTRSARVGRFPYTYAARTMPGQASSDRIIHPLNEPAKVLVIQDHALQQRGKSGLKKFLRSARKQGIDVYIAVNTTDGASNELVEQFNGKVLNYTGGIEIQKNLFPTVQALIQQLSIKPEQCVVMVSHDVYLGPHFHLFGRENIPVVQLGSDALHKPDLFSASFRSLSSDAFILEYLKAGPSAESRTMPGGASDSLYEIEDAESLVPLETEVDAYIRRLQTKYKVISKSDEILVSKMARDYDYRSRGEANQPPPTPRVWYYWGLVWGRMALERAKESGVSERNFVLARDTRKVEPELVESLAAGLADAGLTVTYVAQTAPNCATTYAWAMQQFNPLGGVFLTSSHVTSEPEIQIRGAKVSVRNKAGKLSSLTTSEIKRESSKLIKGLIDNPSSVAEFQAAKRGSIEVEDIDRNSIRMNALVGRVAAIGNDDINIASLSEDFAKSKALEVLDSWEKKVSADQPLKGLRIVVDGANTPSGALAAASLRELGAEVDLINGNVKALQGKHKADPSKPENLRQLQQRMTDSKTEIGLSFDLDGDRGAVVIRKPSGEFLVLPPDNMMAVMIPFLQSRGGYGSSKIKKVAYVRDTLSTDLVDAIARENGAESYQTDAGYVFLKKLAGFLRGEGYRIPAQGERSGHAWLEVTGEYENPIAVSILFLIQGLEANKGKSSETPFYDLVTPVMGRIKQSLRFAPPFQEDFLKRLEQKFGQEIGWEYVPGKDIDQRIIAQGRHWTIQRAMEHFAVGRTFSTVAGNLTVDRILTEDDDARSDDGLFRFMDIQFKDASGKSAGRFVLRASANDPTYVTAYETRVREGETSEDASVLARYQAVGGLVMQFLEKEKFAHIDSPKVKDEGTRIESGSLKSHKEHMRELEKKEAQIIGQKLRTPLDAKGNASFMERFLQGGFWKKGQKKPQVGWGVPEGAAIDGSHADQGTQGYYRGEEGQAAFLAIVEAYTKFFEKHEKRGKPIRYLIKIGIGGQHTPFQGIAGGFEIIDAATGKTVVVSGEYELGKDYAEAIDAVMKKLGIGWDQVGVIPSSKSGSTDESMLIFQQIFYIMLKNAAQVHHRTETADEFAKGVFELMQRSNFENGVERKGEDLFSTFSLDLVKEKFPNWMSRDVDEVFKTALGHMVFETTPRASSSRLAAFIKNSGLDKILGDDAPPMIEMYDNVGGRWTGDVHIASILAFRKLDAKAYWRARHEGVAQVREGRHRGNAIANRLLDENIRHVAMVVPEKFRWAGKSQEQNTNESIWQNGFVNLITYTPREWEAVKHRYQNASDRLVIDLAGLGLSTEDYNVEEMSLERRRGLRDMLSDPSGEQTMAILFADFFTTFYGMTVTLGQRLIARALLEQGLSAADVDLNDMTLDEDNQLANKATRIVRDNLHFLQIYVELGKGLLEERLGKLQEEERAHPGAIVRAMRATQAAARHGELKTNVSIEGYEMPVRLATNSNVNTKALAELIQQAVNYAESQNRKFVPFIYVEGEKFDELRKYLMELGIEWVLQGTGDQHISWQQVLAQPQAYLPFVVSFVPEEGKEAPGLPAIGFAKPYLDHVSAHMVRDYFAEASYVALTTIRASAGGQGFFLRLLDTVSNEKSVDRAFTHAREESNKVSSIAEGRGFRWNPALKTAASLAVAFLGYTVVSSAAQFSLPAGLRDFVAQAPSHFLGLSHTFDLGFLMLMGAVGAWLISLLFSRLLEKFQANHALRENANRLERVLGAWHGLNRISRVGLPLSGVLLGLLSMNADPQTSQHVMAASFGLFATAA